MAYLTKNPLLSKADQICVDDDNDNEDDEDISNPIC